MIVFAFIRLLFLFCISLFLYPGMMGREDCSTRQENIQLLKKRRNMRVRCCRCWIDTRYLVVCLLLPVPKNRHVFPYISEIQMGQHAMCYPVPSSLVRWFHARDAQAPSQNWQLVVSSCDILIKITKIAIFHFSLANKSDIETIVDSFAIHLCAVASKSTDPSPRAARAYSGRLLRQRLHLMGCGHGPEPQRLRISKAPVEWHATNYGA